LSVTFKLITCPVLIIKDGHHTNTIISNNTRHMQPDLIFTTSRRTQSSGGLLWTRLWIFRYYQRRGI